MAFSKIRNYRWLIVGLLFFATCINYLDRQVIGLLKPILEKEFGWKEIDYSHIIMGFTAAYAVGLLFAGKFIDRVGSRMGYTLCVILWSAAGMVHAWAKNVSGFVTARIGLGLGEAGNFPAAMKTVAEWFPVSERGTATGIFNAGASIGVVMALLIAPLILRYYRWQQVFLITGALGFIWLLLWLLFYDIPSKQKRLSGREYEFIKAGQEQANTEVEGKKIKWISLFRLPQTWGFIAGKGLIDPIYWFFLFWLPSYFSATFGLDLKKPSLELMIIYTATTIGSIGGGFLSSRLVKKGWPALNARKAALFLFAIIELSVILIQFVTNVWAAVGLLSLAMAIHQAWATNVFTLAADLFPKEAVGSVVGIGGMAGALGGILFPILVGNLLDSYKTAGHLATGYNILFTVCGFTYLAAFILIHLLTRKPGAN